MPKQDAVLNQERGRALMKDGVAAADAHASEAWKVKADRVLDEVAKQFEFITSDMLWGSLDVPVEARALGGVFVRARARGIIEPTQTWKASGIPKQHARPLKVWKSKIYSQGT
ncbi:MAG: hypothetical protein ACPGYT_11895 [Nitrospirales bacterium]